MDQIPPKSHRRKSFPKLNRLTMDHGSGIQSDEILEISPNFHSNSGNYVSFSPEMTGVKQYVGLSDWPGPIERIVMRFRLRFRAFINEFKYRINDSVSIQNQKRLKERFEFIVTGWCGSTFSNQPVIESSKSFVWYQSTGFLYNII